MPPLFAAQNGRAWVTNPFVFYGISVAFLAYLIYMMIRRRKGERVGFEEPDAEL